MPSWPGVRRSTRDDEVARTVLVTGGGRGIGMGVVAQFLAEGCNLAVLEKDLAAADPGFAELAARASERLWTMAGDLNSAADRQDFVTGALARFGRLDVLVNNAGVSPQRRGDLLAVTEDAWDFVLDTNLKATFFLTQLVARQMIAQPVIDAARGYIVNLGSLNSYAVAVDRAEYCTAKAGLAMLTQLFARRLAAEQIYVHEIRPGVIDTPMTRVVHDRYDRLIAAGEDFPIARWGQPADIAWAVSGLVSGCFRYSTGEVINVDGGFHLRRQ